MKHTCFQPPSHTDTQCFGSYSAYTGQTRSLLWDVASQNTLCSQQRGRHWVDPALQPPVPAPCPKTRRMKSGKEYLHFPTESALLNASYGVALLPCSAHLGIPSPTAVCFSWPCRTPAPKPISNHFEGNSYACQEACIMPSRSHALVLVSSVLSIK